MLTDRSACARRAVRKRLTNDAGERPSIGLEWQTGYFRMSGEPFA
jgi:hypothetical protein